MTFHRLGRVFLAFLSVSLLSSHAWGHGNPIIELAEKTAPAGGSITVTGKDMSVGEVFLIRLEGMEGAIPLGEAKATGTGNKGGFEAHFTLPSALPAGYYRLLAAAKDESVTASADLTVTTPPKSNSALEKPMVPPLQAREKQPAAPATAAPSSSVHQVDPHSVSKATGVHLKLDRIKSSREVTGILSLVASCTLAGLWLVVRSSS